MIHIQKDEWVVVLDRKFTSFEQRPEIVLLGMISAESRVKFTEDTDRPMFTVHRVTKVYPTIFSAYNSINIDRRLVMAKAQSEQEARAIIAKVFRIQDEVSERISDAEAEAAKALNAKREKIKDRAASKLCNFLPHFYGNTKKRPH